MRTPRIVVVGASSGAEVEAGLENFRHLVTVLRRSEGDAVTVIDGAGGVFAARIARVDHDTSSLRIAVGEAAAEPQRPTARLAVAVAVPRGDGMEVAIRFASEIGLTRLVPLVTERTVARPKREGGKVGRWRRIASESAKQCGRGAALEVEDPIALSEFLDGLDSTRCWAAVPGAAGPRESGLLGALEESGGAPIVALVGPEGGFSPRELELLAGGGVRPLGLPTPVLRTPTAVVFIAALVAWAGIAD